jgi:hypothetical protein
MVGSFKHYTAVQADRAIYKGDHKGDCEMARTKSMLRPPKHVSYDN